jgi:prepilin-type N-terminal cleavage/methylation domain-containing protein
MSIDMMLNSSSFASARLIAGRRLENQAPFTGQSGRSHGTMSMRTFSTVCTSSDKERLMKRRAFTLVELLVVVAIIALLLSILLPALGRAKALARKTVCASQLRSVGLATVMYGTDNRDRLPTYFNFSRLSEGVPPGTYAGEPWSCRMVSHYKAQPPQYTWIYGQALLFASEYIGNPRAFFCPSQLPHPDGNPAAWERKPGRTPEWQWDRLAKFQKCGFYSGGYDYNPNAIKSKGGTFVQYHRASLMDVNDPLAHDMITSSIAIPHERLGGSWNVLFPGGSVQSYGNDEALQKIQNPGIPQDKWYWALYEVRSAMGLPKMPESDSPPKYY